MSIKTEQAARDALDLMEDILLFAKRMNGRLADLGPDSDEAMELYGDVYDLYKQAADVAYTGRFDLDGVYAALRWAMGALHEAIIGDEPVSYGALHVSLMEAYIEAEAATEEAREALAREVAQDAAYVQAGIGVYDPSIRRTA